MSDRKLDRLIQTAKRIIPGRQPSEAQHLTLSLKNGNEPFIPTYQKEDYLDVGAFDREDEQAAILITKLRAAADQPQIVVRSNAEIRKITEIRNRYWIHYNTVVDLNQQLKDSSTAPNPP